MDDVLFCQFEYSNVKMIIYFSDAAEKTIRAMHINQLGRFFFVPTTCYVLKFERKMMAKRRQQRHTESI